MTTVNFGGSSYDNPEHKEMNINVDTEQKQNVQTKAIGVDKNVQTLIYNPTTTSSNPVV